MRELMEEIEGLALVLAALAGIVWCVFEWRKDVQKNRPRTR